MSPPSARQDPIQQLGRGALGMDRLVELQDRNAQIEDFNALNNEYPLKPVVRQRKYFSPGAKVVRLRHNKYTKMDTNYKPEIFTVVASSNNGTCRLQDKAGRLLKRRV
ncbi:hypothetical protein PS15m_000906 [Mucor circinelloides]